MCLAHCLLIVVTVVEDDRIAIIDIIGKFRQPVGNVILVHGIGIIAPKRIVSSLFYCQEAAGPLQPIIPPAIIPFIAEPTLKHFSKQ